MNLFSQLFIFIHPLPNPIYRIVTGFLDVYKLRYLWKILPPHLLIPSPSTNVYERVVFMNFNLMGRELTDLSFWLSARELKIVSRQCVLITRENYFFQGCHWSLLWSIQQNVRIDLDHFICEIILTSSFKSG